LISIVLHPGEVSEEGLESPVAGQVDIYLLPDIESSYSIAEVLVSWAEDTGRFSDGVQDSSCTESPL